MSISLDWPEPLVFAQSLSEAGHSTIPDKYIKPPTQRPCFSDASDIEIPIINLEGLLADDATRSSTLKQLFEACREWGFFQVLNHGVSSQLMDRARDVWHGFFHQPMEVKKVCVNSPNTHQGYGSRFGVDKRALLDWGDYYFLQLLPHSLRNPQSWLAVTLDQSDANSWNGGSMEVIDEYSEQVMKLSDTLMKLMSINLGLGENFLQDSFGGVDMAVGLRANYYPKCPQPELTFGISPHSDPNCLTILLPDKKVLGLKVRKNGEWITVKPAPHAFIVNLGDQMQVLTNAIYTSVEHRVTVNSDRERITLGLFYNPKGDLPIGPAKELVNLYRPALYPTTTFDNYKLYVRMKGLNGKAQLEESQNVIQA